MTSPDCDDKVDDSAALKMMPDDLLIARHQLEPFGWVFTHRMRVYHLPSSNLAESLQDCPSFARLNQVQQSRLLRLAMDDLEQSGGYRQKAFRRFMSELTQRLIPIGQLISDNWIVDLETISRENNGQLAEIAARQLMKIRRAAANNSNATQANPTAIVYGNEVAFPLDPSVAPENLRAKLHQNLEVDVNTGTDDSVACDPSEVDDSNSENGANSATSCLEVLPPDQLYRPYLNNWQQFIVSPQQPNSLGVGCKFGAQDYLEQFDTMSLQRRRLITAVAGGLSWRQKQHRQQLLAVRLATRSALISLKHSISVEPAKNYLELYVNMISRAVEHTSLHVRRWSFHLEQSWKEFKDLARDDWN